MRKVMKTHGCKTGPTAGAPWGPVLHDIVTNALEGVRQAQLKQAGQHDVLGT